jgi:hypothetical protein
MKANSRVLAVDEMIFLNDFWGRHSAHGVSSMGVPAPVPAPASAMEAGLV